MQSITKRVLTNDQITMITKNAFGNSIELESISELTDGYFNAAYKLVLSDGRKLVLKVSPDKDIQVMRYEKNLMETEVHVLNKISSLGEIPVPKLLHYENKSSIIMNEYFFMEFIEGIPLNKVSKNLTEEQRNGIFSELGRFVKRYQSVKGNYFGYISQTDKRFSTWYEAFLNMIKELMEDAADKDIRLPCTYEELCEIVSEKQNILNMVEAPSLVHKDLWQGNIFVDPESMKITGIVDCERAIYGDTLLEPVCGFLVNNESFMKNYLGRNVLSKEEQIRINLYKLYLNLIMIIECYYRHYPNNEQEIRARARLDSVLEELKASSQN